MKVLVTGAAGLIGSELCRQLKQSNFYVVGIDNMFRSTKIPDCNEFIECDISKNIIIDEDFEIIFHFAAINGTANFYEMPNKVISNNTRVDLNIFEFSKKCKNLKKFIYASSSEMMSHVNICDESNKVEIDDISNPRWSYKISKMLGENYLHNSNIPWIIIRYFNVYGKETKSGHVVFDQMEKHRNGIYEVIGPNETRCYTYIKDAVDATLVVLNKCKLGEIINIGTNEELSSLDVCKIIANSLGIHNPNYKFIDGRIGSTKRRVPNISTLLNYYPKYSPISFVQGIGRLNGSSSNETHEKDESSF
jgi:UDP-glucose 4-epimerase